MKLKPFGGRYRSIRQALNATNIIVFILVLVPLAISTIYYNTIVTEYRALIENVDRANSLSLVVKTQLYDMAYNLTAGKTDPDSGEAEALVGGIYDRLDTLYENASSPQNANQVVVARNTLGTVEDYMGQIEANIRSQAPVAENESIRDKVDEDSKSMYNVLRDFMASEIELAAQRNAMLQQSSFIMAIVQVGMICVAVAFLVVNNRMLRRRINEPLLRMQDMAGRIAQGNFSIHVGKPEIDELAGLTESLNRMAAELDALMAANIEKQKTLRKAEMQILQAQISPHFLYNTLDTIIALAENDRMDDVVTTTLALSTFHRISLSKGKDWIRVSQEISQIESYLTIQKMRYGALLDYEITVEEGIMNLPILKILLQPLVENAIYHGVKLSRRGGVVRIFGGREGGCLVFRVENSAPGMDAETLENLVAALEAEYDNPTNLEKPGYGLYNVYRRIMLFYETTGGLAIESEPERGTVITLRLPITDGES